MHGMVSSRHYRAIFISDIHLGTRGCQAEYLLDFLRNTESEYLFLVGDIFDGWRLKRTWYWPQSHNDVVQKLLRKARKGTKVIYVAGNHDEALRNYTGVHFGGVEVCNDHIHETADGKRMLVIHGDADRLVDVSGGYRTAEVVPGAELLVLEGMGHDLLPVYWGRIVEAITQLAARAAAEEAP